MLLLFVDEFTTCKIFSICADIKLYKRVCDLHLVCHTMWNPFKIALLWLIRQWNLIVFFCHLHCHGGAQCLNRKLSLTSTQTPVFEFWRMNQTGLQPADAGVGCIFKSAKRLTFCPQDGSKWVFWKRLGLPDPLLGCVAPTSPPNPGNGPWTISYFYSGHVLNILSKILCVRFQRAGHQSCSML